jgi:cytochrome bd ubiquinol oxidase subunit I
MAVSLAFHIVFAVVGIGMPALMAVAEWRWQRTGDPLYRQLARQWARGTAIFFAVGAVSGTVLSFELGLLWPAFMARTGPVVGVPFSLEGFAFFAEAIFLGIVLYGRDRVPPRLHLASGVLVAVSGLASAVFVLMVSSWMNAPTGFRLVGGRLVDVRPVAAMLNPAWGVMTVHMVLAAYLATGFGVAGVHALMLRRRPGSRFHRTALRFGLWMGAVCALLQPLSGDLAARFLAEHQPVKLAAMEGLFRTTRGAPLHLGGIPDASRHENVGGIAIPKALSLLAFHDPDAEVQGLDSVPESEWPPLVLVRVAWQVMVAIGGLLFLVALGAAWRRWRRRPADGSRWMLGLLGCCAPLAFLAIECGWVVTEVGRQPWIVQGVMRTSEAVTPMPHLVVPFLAVTALYLWLAVVVAVLFRRLVLTAPTDADAPATRRGEG